MKKRNILITIILISIVFIGLLIVTNNKKEIKTIKSEKQLLNIYNRENQTVKDVLIDIVTFPFSLMVKGTYDPVYVEDWGNVNYSADFDSEVRTTGTQKEYSTTNIQVENVDEADITKTDGDYIYSISEDNVIITNAINPKDIYIESKIASTDGSVPEDLILNNNQLIVISTRTTATNTYYYYNDNYNTIVKIYNINDKKDPTLIKSYEIYEPYYTSRCIDDQLYVIASGNLRKENNKVVRLYKENNIEKEIPLTDIKYLKDVKTTNQTIITSINLKEPDANININSYLIDISNSYVSKDNIYLLNRNYNYDDEIPPVSKLFGLKGIFGVFNYYDEYDYFENTKTDIYKFMITKNGKVVYKNKGQIRGSTINQYSLDEHNDNLRIATYDSKGARVVILNNSLKQIGATDYVAKGENMYSSRFIGDKAYLVTYRTIDPLYVIDLSNEKSPKVLGELHIPGYSTYLHPYDENHLIGIGMETEEITNKDEFGHITSTTARIVGMKMALFDVSDVNNPIQISQTVIGDQRTTSAILTNPKALLFSKEKNLIAIPVNNYNEDFEIEDDDTYQSTVNSYRNYGKQYIAEGYFVYNITTENGFKLKGVITHEANPNYKYYYYNSKLLRGLYIENNLYTISETAIKVNNLDNLELLDEIKIK